MRASIATAGITIKAMVAGVEPERPGAGNAGLLFGLLAGLLLAFLFPAGLFRLKSPVA